ncbi:hypothetical protein AJ79_00232 [Helicocarpus griseus UAMH5409]|uniref:Myb-like DNA-binding domain-containing protein n=1 Tax=Helicocarpus griseus UAMH5409 TaxID=1447875 RepID=A0A2B7YCK5_9EURO|nr:hypothetical protein AJ79_00232 [Helicocarpus griseus UAMH5409]
MASLKRSKTMPADGQTAKFLYTILKQLDLKSIDWNLVASQLEITNGHAARMRFSRFRQHMEGISTVQRTPRPKKAKVDKAQSSKKQQQFNEVKREPTVKTEQIIKQEPGTEEACDPVQPQSTFVPVEMKPTIVSTAVHPYSMTTVAPADLALPYPASNPAVMFPSPPPTAADWSRIKMEKCEGASDDAVVKREFGGSN